MKSQKTDTCVRTFDGQFEGFLAWEELDQICSQVCVLGPIAGAFGRYVEQFRISPRRKKGYYILERVFQKSIDDARVSLKKDWLYDMPKRPIVTNTELEQDDDSCGPSLTQQMEELLSKHKRRSLGRSNHRRD